MFHRKCRMACGDRYFIGSVEWLEVTGVLHEVLNGLM